MKVDKDIFNKVFLIFCLIGGIGVLVAGISEELVGGIIIGICMILSFFLFYPFGKK